MADVKISALPASTTPLAGSEVLPIVQSGITKKVNVDNLTAGKTVSTLSIAVTGGTAAGVVNGVFLGAANAVSIATNSTERWMVNASGNLNPVGSYGIGTTAAIVNGVVSNTVQAIAATTQDAVKLQGRNGGTGSYVATITPTTLSASRTVTLPNADTTIPVATQVLTFSGPTAARTITLPDANFTVARTDAANSFTGNQTLSTGNLVQGTAAKGLDFTANTAAAGKTSQLLNWYEEGTWTPTIFGDGTAGTQTYAWQYGTYTRVGRVVTCTVSVRIATTSGMAGNITIGGLPFTSRSGDRIAGTVHFNIWGNLTAGQVYIAGYVSPNATTVAVTGSTGATGNLTGLVVGTFTAGSYVDGVITYIAA